MIGYIVSATVGVGEADALSRGWIQLARHRFVTPERDYFQLITRFHELTPLGNGNPICRVGDYESGPSGEGELEAWMVEKEKFDQFVADGHGKWVDKSVTLGV